jgi:hypothetical protein
MDFQGLGVTGQDAVSLTERFRFELMKTGRFDVMERNEMNVILEEQAFQQTGCVDQSCAVEAGRLIAVKKMVAGTISKVGGIYSLNVKMLDVETGRVDLNEAEDCDCPIEKVLTVSMGRLARKISGMQVDEVKTSIEVRRGDASLYVETQPAGANVYLDGKMMDGITPVMLKELTPGSHIIMVKKGESDAKSLVLLSSNQIKRVSLRLSSQKTMLMIATEPPDAQVYINRPFGVKSIPDFITPAIYKKVQGDTVKVSIFRPGYADTSVKVNVIANQMNNLSFTLSPVNEEIKLAQNKMMKKRRQWRISRVIGPPSIASVAGGLVMAGLAYYDYATALKLKDELKASGIRFGDEFDEKEQENIRLTDAAIQKTKISAVLLGVGAPVLTIAIAFYF